MQAWLAARKAIAVDKRLPGTRPSTSQQLPAPGWTNIIYSARVLKVLHSEERLILRVQGLPFVATSCIERFNIQFMCSSERPGCILFALQLVQQALLSRGLHGNTLLNGIDTGSTQQDKSRWMRSMIFPTPQDCEMQDNLHIGGSQESADLDLNREQRRAVNSIWSQDYGNLPFLISGPPGTGKTKTVIETVLQLVKKTTEHAHILLCAPSDPAADTLAQHLRAHLTTGELLRLHRPSRMLEEVPGALLPYCCILDSTFALPVFQAMMRYTVVVTTCHDACLLTRARLTNTDLYTVECQMQRITR